MRKKIFLTEFKREKSRNSTFWMYILVSEQWNYRNWSEKIVCCNCKEQFIGDSGHMYVNPWFLHCLLNFSYFKFPMKRSTNLNCTQLWITFALCWKIIHPWQNYWLVFFDSQFFFFSDHSQAQTQETLRKILGLIAQRKSVKLWKKTEFWPN